MKAKKTKLIYQITRLYLKANNKCNGMIAFNKCLYLNDGTSEYITGIDKCKQQMQIICHVENNIGSSLGWYSITEYKKRVLKKIKKQLNSK